MEQKKYYEDLSEQEIYLMEAIGRELPPHRPEGVSEQREVVYYTSREEVPEQARDLWDLAHGVL